MHTFIAHSRADEFFVRQMAAVLERFGFATWLEASGERTEAIPRNAHDAVAYARAVIFVVSAQSIESMHVQAEIKLARDLAIPIIPVLRTRRRDLVPHQFERSLEQALAFDASDPEALDEVFDLLLARLEAIIDKSPPRYVSAQHILKEMRVDDHFGLSVGAPTIRSQIEDVVSDFGELAGSLDLFDRIEADLTQHRESSRVVDASQSCESPRAMTSLVNSEFDFAALDCEIAVERLDKLCGELATRVSALAYPSAVSCALEKPPRNPACGGEAKSVDATFVFSGEPPELKAIDGDGGGFPSYEEITDALCRATAGLHGRRDKSERLLAGLGLQALSKFITQCILRDLSAMALEQREAVISEIVQGALLRAEVTDAGATGLPSGAIVDLVDILDANISLTHLGMRPVVVRPLCNDTLRYGHKQAPGVVLAGHAFSGGVVKMAPGKKRYSDHEDIRFGPDNCISIFDPNTRPQ